VDEVLDRELVDVVGRLRDPRLFEVDRGGHRDRIDLHGEETDRGLDGPIVSGASAELRNAVTVVSPLREWGIDRQPDGSGPATAAESEQDGGQAQRPSCV